MALVCNEAFKIEHNFSAQHFPDSMLCIIKDTNHNYVATNDKSARVLGFLDAKQLTSASKLVTDDTILCKASELAENFRSEDKLSGKAGSVMSICQAVYNGNEKKLLLSEKAPIINERNDIIGYFCSCIDLTATRVINLQPLFALAGIENKLSEQFSIIIKPTYPGIKLSDRQTECLYYIINGYSSAEIAQFCQLSRRTVETYIEHLKNKLSCDSKQQLIEKAIGLGYLEMIPQVIFDKYTN